MRRVLACSPPHIPPPLLAQLVPQGHTCHYPISRNSPARSWELGPHACSELLVPDSEASPGGSVLGRSDGSGLWGHTELLTGSWPWLSSGHAGGRPGTLEGCSLSGGQPGTGVGCREPVAVVSKGKRDSRGGSHWEWALREGCLEEAGPRAGGYRMRPQRGRQ